MASATAAITIAKPPSLKKLSARASNFTHKAKPNIPQIAVKPCSSYSVLSEKVVSGVTAAAVVAAMVIPEVAEAAQPGISPSLKNFLLSIVSGGVVLGVIVGVVIGVSNFDPVKRA